MSIEEENIRMNETGLRKEYSRLQMQINYKDLHQQRMLSN